MTLGRRLALGTGGSSAGAPVAAGRGWLALGHGSACCSAFKSASGTEPRLLWDGPASCSAWAEVLRVRPCQYPCGGASAGGGNGGKAGAAATGSAAPASTTVAANMLSSAANGMRKPLGYMALMSSRLGSPGSRSGGSGRPLCLSTAADRLCWLPSTPVCKNARRQHRAFMMCSMVRQQRSMAARPSSATTRSSRPSWVKAKSSK